MWHSDTVTGNGKALRITLLTTLPPALSAYHSRHRAATRAPSRAPPPAAPGPPAPAATAAILAERPPLPARPTARRGAGGGERGKGRGLRPTRLPIGGGRPASPPCACRRACHHVESSGPASGVWASGAGPISEAEEGDAGGEQWRAAEWWAGTETGSRSASVRAPPRRCIWAGHRVRGQRLDVPATLVPSTRFPDKACGDGLRGSVTQL